VRTSSRARGKTEAGRGRSSNHPPNKQRHWQDGRNKQSPSASQQYKLCLTNNRPSTHSTVQCNYLDANDRKAIIRLTLVDDIFQDADETEEATSVEDDYEPGEDNLSDQDQEYQPSINSGKIVLNGNKLLKRYHSPVTAQIKSAHKSPPYQLTRVPNISSQGSLISAYKGPFRIKKINIYDSNSGCKTGQQNVYIVLNSGATTSLISLDKANFLMLQIKPTVHRAVQVNKDRPESRGRDTRSLPAARPLSSSWL
jgi:hypothetical protein